MEGNMTGYVIQKINQHSADMVAHTSFNEKVLQLIKRSWKTLDKYFRLPERYNPFIFEISNSKNG
jgi:hypothetical protein